jgi:hypothetical protein
MAQFLLGPGGRLLLLGGKPLAITLGQAPTTAIRLTDWYLSTSYGYTTRFNIQTTAASNDTTADVPVVFTYTGGTPSSVQARVIDGSGVAVPGFDWTDITTTVTTSGTTGLGYLQGVPDGINYRREVRVGASTTVKDTDRAYFNIGINVLPWGQSNMRGTLDSHTPDGSGITRDSVVPGTASTTEWAYYNNNGTGAYFGPGGFDAGGNNNASIGSYTLEKAGGLSMLRLLGTTLQNKRSKKVGIALNPWANNGQAMSFFMNASGVIGMLSNVGTVSPNIGFSSPAQYITGDYRIVAWHQGESDSTTITRTQRRDDLIKFCQAHIAQVLKFNRPSSKLTFLFAFMGVGSPPQMEVLRGAVLDLIAYVKQNNLDWDVRIGWNCIDFDPAFATPPDTLHFGGWDQLKSCRRMTQAAMHVLDPVAVKYGAIGPQLTGAVSRTGDDVTLTVLHEGLKDDGQPRSLVAKTPGSPITGWYANTAADFSGTDIALTNVTIVDSTHIRVTATGAPATFYIKHCGGKYYTPQSYTPNVSNLIYDNFAYPTGANAGDQFVGLPLLPTPDAIKVGP